MLALPKPKKSRAGNFRRTKRDPTLPGPATPMTRSRTKESLEESMQNVFGNHLITGMICSYMNSQKDVVRFRQVNRQFEIESINQLKIVHKPINLATEKDVENFLQLMKNRAQLNLTRLPFSNFKINLNLKVQIMEKFGSAVGEYVRSYSLHLLPDNSRFDVNAVGAKVAILLSYSPNIIEIDFRSAKSVQIPADQLQRMPKSFPYLKTIDVNYWKTIKSNTASALLLHLLITRSPCLKYLKVPLPAGEVKQPETSVLQVLSQNHQQHPLIHFADILQITPTKFQFIQELTRMKLRSSFLMVELFDSDFSDAHVSSDDIRNMMDAVSSWLASQTDSLDYLIIAFESWQDQFQDPITVQFRIPILKVLTSLTINFEMQNHNDSNPIVPLVSDQFPLLQKLNLLYYHQDYQIFGTNMPGVEELELSELRSLFTDPSLRTIFPNLTRLKMDFCRDFQTITRSTIAFVLTHLTQITQLEINLITRCIHFSSCQFGYHYGSSALLDSDEMDLWDILTGGAPRLNIDAFESQTFRRNAEARALTEPSNGIYAIPSLRNMTALKKLRFRVGTFSNLYAVMYMTLTGGLGSLQFSFQANKQKRKVRQKKDAFLDYYAAHGYIELTAN